MHRRTLRVAVVSAVAALLLSACELTVRIETDVHADGSGVFGLEVQLDRELFDRVTELAAEGGSDLGSLRELFTGLAAQGWETTESRPGGGLLLEARRPFADGDDFGRALAELGGAGAPGDSPLDLGGLVLDHAVERSLLRTEATFSGQIDLRFGEDLSPVLEQLREVLQQSVRFEVRARLPGAVAVHEGGGVVEGDEVVWRPLIGEETRFLAASSQVRTGPMLAVAVPAVLLLLLALWAVFGRKPRAPLSETEARVPAEQPQP